MQLTKNINTSTSPNWTPKLSLNSPHYVFSINAWAMAKGITVEQILKNLFQNKDIDGVKKFLNANLEDLTGTNLKNAQDYLKSH
jgi:hypothetical protein